MKKSWIIEGKNEVKKKKKKKNQQTGKYGRLCLIEFPRLFLIIEEKCIIILKVILNECRRNIKGN